MINALYVVATGLKIRRFPAIACHETLLLAVWRNVFGRDEAKLKPISIVCSRHFVNGDSQCGPLLVPALLTPAAIAEDVMDAVLPPLAPIVGPSTTV